MRHSFLLRAALLPALLWTILAVPATASPLFLVSPPGSAVRQTAVVLVPDEAKPIALYAAEELVSHIELATGVRLAVFPESSCPADVPARVYLGATVAARRIGIDVDALPSEACVLRTHGNALFIAAQDGPGDPLSFTLEESGTLWGVYEFLERALKARWLWPGSLGTSVERANALAAGPFDEMLVPRLKMRYLRPGLGLRGFAQGDERLGFSPEQREHYGREQTVFLRRHRMGRSSGLYHGQRSFGRGHAFGGWWERFGEEHPEWFHLLPDGTRGPDNPDRPDRYTMCVSNPAFHRKIVELWQEEREKHPGEPVNIGIGENDFSAECVCSECRAWDGPDPDTDILPEGLERSYLPMQAGTRYARFAKSVHALASEIDPGVKINYYAYLNYFWAPPDLKLHPNIVIGFVPWFRWAGWFPRTGAEHEWIKEQWLGWQRTGATLYYRPNWFLDGYTMPHVYMTQFADAFQFYAREGMLGTDFDTLQGMWAAQGPHLYLLARIHTRPDAPLETLLEEYYGAFSPAAEAVRRYFDYWEAYSLDNRERAARAIQSRRSGHFRRYALYAEVANELYPLDVFAPAFALLDAAAAAAGQHDDAVYADRVVFLREGLTHARLCVETALVMNNAKASREERAAALQRLADYRRTVEHTGIVNMDRAAIIETDSWQGQEVFKSPWTGR